MIKLRRSLWINEIDENRFENCTFYEKCLYEAAVLKWRSFSCRGCEKYESNESVKIENLIYVKESVIFSTGEIFFDDDDESGD